MLRIAALLVFTAALTITAHAGTRDYRDPVAGYSLKLPDGWTDPAGGITTSPDTSVRCTITAQHTPQTAAMTQEQVNTAMQAYTVDVWRTRFFTAGITGSIDHSGITKMEQYDAPWARGRLSYPNGAAAKFGVIMLSAPGRLTSITCSADPAAYDNHLADITNLLNWLRPL